MKKSLKALQAFETQTEQELREVMGGSFMPMYDILPEEDLMITTYSVFVPDSKEVK